MEAKPVSPAFALEQLLKWVFEQNAGKWNSLTTPDVVVQACSALNEHQKKPCPQALVPGEYVSRR